MTTTRARGGFYPRWPELHDERLHCTGDGTFPGLPSDALVLSVRRTPEHAWVVPPDPLGEGEWHVQWMRRPWTPFDD